MLSLDQDLVPRRIFVFYRRQSRTDPPRLGGVPVIDEYGRPVLRDSIIIENDYFVVTGPVAERHYGGKLIIAIPVIYTEAGSPLWNAADATNTFSREAWRAHGEKHLGRWT